MRRIGSLLSILGGILCMLSYPVPWVVGHPSQYGEGYLVPPLEYGYVWSGHHSLEDTLWPTIPYSVSTTLTLLMAALPLLMVLVAMIAGAFVWMRGSARLSRGVGWVYWTATVLGTTALLVMTYALDPWNLRHTWLLTHEWAAPPSPAPGIFFGYTGAVAIIAGGFLLRDQRRVALAAEHA